VYPKAWLLVLLYSAVALLAVSLGLRSASAFEITPVGAVQVSALASPPDYSSGWGWAYGGIFGQFIRPDISIEFGFLYARRKSNQGVSPTSTYSYNYDEFPLVVRVQPVGSHFSFAAGAYYAHAVGNIQITSANVSGASYQSYEDAQISRQDYGVTGGIGIRWPIAKRISFYGDGRFIYGFKNIDNSGGQGLRWRDYFQGLAGLSFSIG
jgi:hypothetical protein